MLTCVYHPLHPFRIVEAEEADKLKATGVWFDCPRKAANCKDKVSEEVKAEAKATNKTRGKK
jgi:hypothetical protein